MVLISAIFLGLILIVLLIAASLPNHFNIEKTIVIDKPVEEVMNRVGDLNFYKQWNPWQQQDPSATSDITGTPNKPGHKYAWQGKKAGIGSLTLREINNKHIHFDLQFIKPWKSQAKDNWLFEPWGNDGTKVTWQNNGSSSMAHCAVDGSVDWLGAVRNIHFTLLYFGADPASPLKLAPSGMERNVREYEDEIIRVMTFSQRFFRVWSKPRWRSSRRCPRKSAPTRSGSTDLPR